MEAERIPWQGKAANKSGGTEEKTRAKEEIQSRGWGSQVSSREKSRNAEGRWAGPMIGSWAGGGEPLLTVTGLLLSLQARSRSYVSWQGIQVPEVTWVSGPCKQKCPTKTLTPSGSIEDGLWVNVLVCTTAGKCYIIKCQGINSSLIICFPAVHPNIPEQIKIAAAEL